MPPLQSDFIVPPYFVHIIESNQVREIQQRFSEGAALQNVFHFCGVTSAYYTSVARDDFDIQMRRFCAEAIRTQLLPILHLSTHGSLHGIHLTVGQVIGWQELAQMLEPLRQYNGGNYIVCLSLCEGLNALSLNVMALFPPLAIVGTTVKVPWSDNVVGFAAFYHLLNKQKSIRQAVDGMKAASGHDNYAVITS